MVRVSGLAGAVGLEIVASVAGCYLGGQWLDGKLGTTPWLKWIGMGLGIGAAVLALMRVTKDYKKSLNENDDARKP